MAVLTRILLPRFASGLLMLVLVAILIFAVLRLLPIDPVGMSLPPGATEADRVALRAQFGLDLPVTEQFARWFMGLLSGDFGVSINLRRDAGSLVLSVLPATLELVIAALTFGVGLGVAGGLALFAVRGSWAETAGDVLSSILVSIPEFVWALLAILVVGVWLGSLPFIGRIDPGYAIPARTGFLLVDTVLAGRPDAFANALAHLVLPSAALGLALAPLITRVLRSSLVGLIVEEYVQLARLRGLGEREVLLRHALPNAALPTLSLIGVQAGFMFGGTLLIEVIFGWPGLGSLMVQAVRTGDIPIIQAAALSYCMAVLIINIAADLATVALDPRLRAR